MLSGYDDEYDIYDKTYPIVVMIVVYFPLIWLLYSSQFKINQIRHPLNSATYNIITVYILKAVQVSLIVAIFMTSVRLFFFLLFDQFDSLTSANNYLLWRMYNIISTIFLKCTDFVYLLQIYEWCSLIYII